MLEGDGLGLILADQGLGGLGGLGRLGGLFSGLFGGLGCLLGGLFGCLLGSLFGLLFGSLFGGLLGGGFVFLGAGEDLAVEGADGVVIFVSACQELHVVLAVLGVVADLQAGDVADGEASVVQCGLLGLIHTDEDLSGIVRLFGGDFTGGNFVGGQGDVCVGVHVIEGVGVHVGCCTAGGQEQCKDQGQRDDGLFHFCRLLSDYFVGWMGEKYAGSRLGTGGSFCYRRIFGFEKGRELWLPSLRYSDHVGPGPHI